MEENLGFEQVITEEVQENIPDTAGFFAELKKYVGKIGWKYALFLVATIIFQIVFGMLIPEKYISETWVSFLSIIIPMHVLGFGLLILLTSKMPTVKIEKKKMSFGKFIICVFIGAGICFVGMGVGLAVHSLITLPFSIGLDQSSALGQLMMGSDAFWRILTVGICAPIVEEFIFRKLLIDRVAKYGEFVAIMLSGIMFGLFHGNFQQAFFAAGLGMFWAFIYLRTGKIWYTIAMHMVINLTTSVVTTYLTQWTLQYASYAEDPDFAIAMANGDPNAVMAGVSSLVLVAWEGFLAIFAIVGIILFFVNRKKFKLNPAPVAVKKGTLFAKSVFNGGMILFWIACLILFVFGYGSIIASALL